MKFNFFVLIVCLMIHFIAQAGMTKKASEQKPASAKKAVAQREVAASAPCDCEKK